MENITPGKWYTSSNKFTVLAGEDMQAIAHIMNSSEEERIANADLIAAAPETARELAEARARIAELESAVGAVNRWWKFAQENTHRNREERMRLLDAALGKCEAAHAMPQEEKGTGLEEMLEATPDRLQGILQDALYGEYMRPCDERP